MSYLVFFFFFLPFFFLFLFCRVLSNHLVVKSLFSFFDLSYQITFSIFFFVFFFLSFFFGSCPIKSLSVFVVVSYQIAFSLFFPRVLSNHFFGLFVSAFLAWCLCAVFFVGSYQTSLRPFLGFCQTTFTSCVFVPLPIAQPWDAELYLSACITRKLWQAMTQTSRRLQELGNEQNTNKCTVK